MLPGPNPVRVLEPEEAGDFTSLIPILGLPVVGVGLAWGVGLWCAGCSRVDVPIFKAQKFSFALEVTEACVAPARS